MARRRKIDTPSIDAPSMRRGGGGPSVPDLGSFGGNKGNKDFDFSNRRTDTDFNFSNRRKKDDFEFDLDANSRKKGDFDADGNPRRKGDADFDADGNPRRKGDTDFDADGKPKKSSARKKALEFCKKNPKTCAGAVAGAGFAAYVGKKYKDLKEEEKKCLEQCYPSDWTDYVEGTVSEPKYKTRLDFSEIEDEDVLDGIEENLCNPENLKLNDIKQDKKSCDTFCEASCDVTLADALRETVGDAGRLAGSGANLGANMAKDLITSFLEGLGIDLEKLKSYGKMAGIVIIIICLLSLAMKFM